MAVPVYIGMGSNIACEANLCKAVAAMRKAFGVLRLSPVYQSAAVGFEGDDFLNMVVVFETMQSVVQVVAKTHQIEDELGRDRSQPHFSDRSIDLDLLLYGSLVVNQSGIRIPRQEILLSAHVLKPLQDLIADNRHPVSGQRYGDIWQDMAGSAPELELVELDFD